MRLQGLTDALDALRNGVKVEISTPTVPAVVLRLVLIPLVAVGGTIATGNVLVAGIAALLLALFPNLLLVALAVLVGAVSMFSSTPEVMATVAMAATLHSAYVVVTLVEDLPLNGRVSVRLLGSAALGFVTIQLVSLAVIAVTFVALQAVPAMPWLTVAGVGVVAAAFTVIVVRALNHRDR